MKGGLYEIRDDRMPSPDQLVPGFVESALKDYGKLPVQYAGTAERPGNYCALARRRERLSSIAD